MADVKSRRTRSLNHRQEGPESTGDGIIAAGHLPGGVVLTDRMSVEALNRERGLADVWKFLWNLDVEIWSFSLSDSIS